ncbi:hypothetical protein [Brevibacterium atlanticum]|uniref:hypothetical protein n=1 Tax=Brevibacterium atlanticum TaxID=2697563 RepID=UPI00141FF6F7|nr:hypothetical protein [Brevibacterium atlanticum]
MARNALPLGSRCRIFAKLYSSQQHSIWAILHRRVRFYWWWFGMLWADSIGIVAWFILALIRD